MRNGGYEKLPWKRGDLRQRKEIDRTRVQLPQMVIGIVSDKNATFSPQKRGAEIAAEFGCRIYKYLE